MNSAVPSNPSLNVGGGSWFKRAIARIVLISFTFGQLGPLAPARASAPEDAPRPYVNRLPTIQINLSKQSDARYVLSARSSVDNRPQFEEKIFDLNDPASLTFNEKTFKFKFSHDEGLEIGYLPRKFNYLLNIEGALNTKNSLGIEGFFHLQSALSYTCHEGLWAERGIRLNAPLVEQKGENPDIRSDGKIAIYTELLKSGAGVVKGPTVVLNAARREGRGRIKARSVTFEEHLHPFAGLKTDKIIWSLNEGGSLTTPLATSSFLEIEVNPAAATPFHVQADIQSTKGFNIKAPHVVWEIPAIPPLANIASPKVTWFLEEGRSIATPLSTASFLEIALSPQATKPLDVQANIKAGKGLSFSSPSQPIVIGVENGPAVKIETDEGAFTSASKAFDLLNGEIRSKGGLTLQTEALKTRQGLLSGQDVTVHAPTAAIDPRTRIKANHVTWKAPVAPPLGNIEADRVIWSLNDGCVINTKLVTPSFLEIAVNNPRATRPLHILADIEAGQGLKFSAPKAVLIGVENGAFVKLAAQGPFESVSQTFDLVHGGVAAAQAFVQAPSGISIGRLVKDPTRDLFATFHCHGQCRISHNLGVSIISPQYQFLGQTLTNIYDGHHLLTLPVAMPNASFFNVNGLTEFKGPLLHRGKLETVDFIIDSPRDSICEAGAVKVSRDFNLRGGSNLYIKRCIGELNFNYWLYEIFSRSPRSYAQKVNIPKQVLQPTEKRTYHFAGSDPADFKVYGKMHADRRSTIFNESSILYVHQKTPETKIEPRQFKADLYQKFIGGTVEERRSLSRPLAHVRLVHSLDSRIVIPENSCYKHQEIITHAVGFLKNTNNFEGSQILFPDQTSFSSGVCTSVNDTQIAGYWSAPATLMVVGNGGLVLGSPNPYYIEKKDPVRNLLANGFNLYEIYITPNLRKTLAEAEAPQFHFKIRELFWFDNEKAQQFYKDVKDHAAVSAPGGFKKLESNALLSLSPKYLLDKVREQCQEALMRGYIYDNRIIDEELLKELHRNMTAYLRENRLWGADVEKALTTKDVRIPHPSKPVIFYRSVMNDEGLEELEPGLIFPLAMMDEARSERGGKIRTNVLAVVPEGLSPKQMISYFQDKPSMQRTFIEFFKQNPEASRLLTNGALAIQDGQGRVQARETPPPVSQGPVTFYGKMDVGTLAAIPGGKLTSYADIKAVDVLLASLFDDVVVESQVERVRDGSGGFRDYIPLEARIAAQGIIAILAGRNAAFIGAETESVLGTHIEALAVAYNLPAFLVRQSIHQYWGKKHRGTITDTYVEPHSTSHTSKGPINTIAGDEIVCHAVKMKGDSGVMHAQNDVKILDAHRTHTQSGQISKKGGHWHGSKTLDINSSSIWSVGSTFGFKNGLEIYSEHGNATLTNPVITTGEGELERLDGDMRFIRRHDASLRAEVPGRGEIDLYEFIEPGDGDCAFHCLGISRNKAVKLLLDHADDPKVREFVAPEIRAAIAEIEEIDGITESKIPLEIAATKYKDKTYADLNAVVKSAEVARLHAANKVNENLGLEGANRITDDVPLLLSKIPAVEWMLYAEEVAALTRCAAAEEKAKRDLDEYLRSPEVFRAFIEGYYKTGGWLTYLGDAKGHEISSTLEALAYLTPVNVQVFAKNDRGLLEAVHEYHFSNDAPLIRMHHTANGVLGGERKRKRRNHFNTLATMPEIDGTPAALETFPKTIIRAPEGRVEILLGTNESHSSCVTTSSNMAINKVRRTEESDKTYSTPHIKGPVEIHSRETFVQKVRGQALEYLERIEQHGPPVIEQILDEVHTRSVKTVRGPSQALGAVVALAATMATSGWAAPIAEAIGLAGSITGTAMVSAAISALSAQTAVGLMTHKGNAGRVLKDVTSKDSLKSLATDIGVAALVGHGGGSGQSLSLLQHFQVQGMRSFVRAGFDVAVRGKDADESLRQALKNTATSALGAYVAGKIGQAYKGENPSLDYFSHKLCHAVLGGALGSVMSDDPLSGAVAGAGGAVLAEAVAESLTEHPVGALERMIAEAEVEGNTLQPKDYLKAYERHIQSNVDIARLCTGVAAMMVGTDPVANRTAQNALENNLVPAFYGVAAALMTPEGLAMLGLSSATIAMWQKGMFEPGSLNANGEPEDPGNSAQETTTPARGTTAATAPPPLPPEKPDEGSKKSYKTRDFEKNDDVGLKRFTKRLKDNVLEDPKTKQRLVPDHARNSGGSGHGGSYWKLLDRGGHRIGTISKDGRWLRD